MICNRWGAALVEAPAAAPGRPDRQRAATPNCTSLGRSTKVDRWNCDDTSTETTGEDDSTVNRQHSELLGEAPFASRWRRAHLTVEQRMARGRAARRTASRSAHARWAPPPGRAAPVAVLAEQAESRVAELVPIRYGRMLASPLAFYRGAALIMAADLAVTPVSGVTVQLCGDAHLSNFGVFGTPERQMIFDIN